MLTYMYTLKTLQKGLQVVLWEWQVQRGRREQPEDLSPGLPLQRKAPFPPIFFAFRNSLPPGPGTQTGNTLWLEKRKKLGVFFFLPLHNIMTPI